MGARKKKEVEKTKAERVEIVLDEKAPSFEFPDVGAVQDTAVLKFDNCSYAYTEGKPVIKNLSFGVYMDSRIALVGANGAALHSLTPTSIPPSHTPHCRHGQVDHHEAHVWRDQA